MAKAEGISVAVEKAVHSALAELAQKVMNQHGIQINNVTFDWLDASDSGKIKSLVCGTNADTTVRL